MSDTLTDPSAYTRRPPVVPLRLTEVGRQEMLITHPELLAAGELCRTTDELRLWQGATLLGPVVDHGSFADETTLEAWYLSPSCTRGVHAGDTAYVESAGCLYSVSSGHAATAVWRRNTVAAAASDPAGTAASAVDAHNSSATAHADLRTALAGKWSTPANASALGDISRAQDNSPLWRGAAWPGGGGSGGTAWYAAASGPPTASLVWTANGDTNGVVHFAGLAFGGTAFANPCATGGPMRALRSSDAAGAPGNLTERTTNDTYTTNTANSWACIDLGAYALRVTDYSLRHLTSYADDYIRTWRLQGANTIATWSVAGVAAATWTDLDIRAGDTTITSPASWGHWVANQEVATEYRYIRILQDGANATGRHYLAIAEVEFYGQLGSAFVAPVPAGAGGWMVNAAGTTWCPYYGPALVPGSPL